jgi:hypothetical protein
MGGMDWIDVAENRDRWWAFVNAVMDLWCLWNAGNFLTTREPVSLSRKSLFLGVSKKVS